MQKTAYEMRISDWSSDVCSSDLQELAMARLTIRLPDELYDRLAADADAAGVPTAAFVRDALEQLNGADPFGFHARFDELHSTVLQVLAILASDVGARAPKSLAQGVEDTRRLLDRKVDA